MNLGNPPSVLRAAFNDYEQDDGVTDALQSISLVEQGSSTSSSFHSPIPSSSTPSLPFDCLVEICTWVAYANSDYVEEELLVWPITSTSPALRNLCLVSKDWLEPAQQTLFKSIAFTDRTQCELFLRTAEERPTLPACTRAVQVGIWKEQDGGSPRTIAAGQELTRLMLTAARCCVNCKHLTVHPLVHPDAMETFFLIEALPLRSLSCRLFDAHSLISAEVCIQFYVVLYHVIIAHPALTSFELNFKPPYTPTPDEIVPAQVYTSRISSFHCTINVPHVLYQCLPMMANTLRLLSLYTEYALDASIAAPIFRSLTHLVDLRFESNVSLPLSLSPFNNNNAEHTNRWIAPLLETAYPNLVRLSVSEQDVSPSLFAHPPPSLELLEYINFCARPDERFHEFAALARGDSKSAKATKAAGVTFSAMELVFVADQQAFEERVTEEEVRSVVEAFGRQGVRFRVVHEIGTWVEKRLVEL